MPEDIDEIYTPRELLGFWDEGNTKEEDDPWDFKKYSPLHKGVGRPVAIAASEREIAVAMAKEQALKALIPMLLRGRPVLSARKLCQVASFKMRGMKYPDVEMLILMAHHVPFAYAKRRLPDTGEDSFKGYAAEDWRYTNFCHYPNPDSSGASDAVRMAMYENNRRIAMPWEENMTPASWEVLATLPVVLSFEIDIDTDKVPRVTVPFREFHIAAPFAECANVTKFIVAHNRHPEKYSPPKNLEEWQNTLKQLNPDDYASRY